MKRSLVLAIAFAFAASLFIVGNSFGGDRVSYSEKEFVEYYVDADGKTAARTVMKSVATVVSDPETGEAAPTPQAEVDRVLALLPKPAVGFVDYGCGADARWCIAAAKRWGVRVTGVEIDRARAARARDNVHAAGLGKLVTIVEGDATTTDVQADVGVAYLYADVLEKLKPKFEKLTAFASYLHQPPGLAVTQNGDSWFYTKPQPVGPRVASASWNGRTYSAPMCNSPRCAMCQDIRAQLSAATVTQQSSGGRYVKHCSNGVCWYEWVPD